MTLHELRASLQQDAPPAGSPPLLAALWHDAKGDWNEAHRIAQDVEDENGAWMHAYLHRKEGDESNAGYWYRRAGRPHARTTLQEEWEEIATALLERS